MYANFYDKRDICIFSVEVNGEKQAEDLADKVYSSNHLVADWTYTDKPMSRNILT